MTEGYHQAELSALVGQSDDGYVYGSLHSPSPLSSGVDEAKYKAEDLHRLLVPDLRDLPHTPPTAVESNFVAYFATDFINLGHDQYVYRHANGLCIVGLAASHPALKERDVIITVDFNVGKSDRSAMKVTGKRKKNALHVEPNSALCKVCTPAGCYVVRCCVKGSLLEVNDRLAKQPELLLNSGDREGFVAVIMTKPGWWSGSDRLCFHSRSTLGSDPRLSLHFFSSFPIQLFGNRKSSLNMMKEEKAGGRVYR